MDPDPNGLYTKRKQQRIGIGATSSVTDSSNGDANKPSVKYPSDGWSTSLEKMPMFTRAEMNEHIARSGKSISDIQHHSVPTSLRKFFKAKRPNFSCFFVTNRQISNIVLCGKQLRRS